MIGTDQIDYEFVAQQEAFESLYASVNTLMRRFGQPDYQPEQPHGDYQIDGDYSEYPEVVIFVDNLEMLRPDVIGALQELVGQHPGWQITVTVAVRGRKDEWPRMGLFIRPHEIIDGLQRQYFPQEFQDLDYGELEGARPGTAYD